MAKCGQLVHFSPLQTYLLYCEILSLGEEKGVRLGLSPFETS
jgi:hypothetical protein